MEKTLEMRVEELERMLFLTKNVLSFDEARHSSTCPKVTFTS